MPVWIGGTVPSTHDLYTRRGEWIVSHPLRCFIPRGKRRWYPPNRGFGWGRNCSGSFGGDVNLFRLSWIETMSSWNGRYLAFSLYWAVSVPIICVLTFRWPCIVINSYHVVHFWRSGDRALW